MFNPTMKMRVALLLFLIVVINKLICIGVDIGLDMSTMKQVKFGNELYLAINLVTPNTSE